VSKYTGLETIFTFLDDGGRERPSLQPNGCPETAVTRKRALGFAPRWHKPRNRAAAIGNDDLSPPSDLLEKRRQILPHLTHAG
jgi:hypothetical protein